MHDDRNSTDKVTQSDVDDQGSTREEMRRHALLSRNSYELGVLPSEEAGNDIDRALEQDDTTLGVAYKFLVQDDIDDANRISKLQEHFGQTSPGTAVGLRQHLDALRLGIFPKGVSTARQINRRMRTFMQRHDDLSVAARDVMEQNRALLEKIFSDPGSLDLEEQEAEASEADKRSLLENYGGVYVYTYPHYYRNPYEPSSPNEKAPDRTLMKVGYAQNNIMERINQQTNSAGIPEHRRILRAYIEQASKSTTNASKSPSSNKREVERAFHNLLDSAGHAGPKRGSTERHRGGMEWFCTSLEFLDAIADALGLEIIGLEAREDEL